MKGSRLHLDLFKVFFDLAESRSFSKTAGRNYLTQGAVSQQISFLERHVGKKLVERRKGRFALTEEGEIFLEACRKILEAYQESLDKIRHPSELSGTVSVETTYSIGLHQLAPFVKTFMRRHDMVNLHVEYNRSDRIYSDVRQGLCHMGIVAYPGHHPLIRVIPFKKERLGFVCSPEHPLAAKKKVGFKDLERLKFIAFDRDMPTRKAVDGILRARRVFVNIVHEFDNIEIMKRSVEIGAGVSILPENTVYQEVKNKTLVYIPFSGCLLLRPTGIIFRQGRSLSRAAQEFIQWLSK